MSASLPRQLTCCSIQPTKLDNVKQPAAQFKQRRYDYNFKSFIKFFYNRVNLKKLIEVHE